jgi:hypothetical protein
MCIAKTCVGDEGMSIEQWLNAFDREKLKYSEKSLFLYQFVRHKSLMDWPEIEPEPARREAGD